MKILLTGGNGFIGKNLKVILKEQFEDFQVISPASNELDLRNYNEINDFLEEGKFDIVIHLASRMAGIGELINKPLFYFEENTMINFNIVKAARKTGVKRFLTFGSTCGFSPKAALKPLIEESLWEGRPENTYGTAKVMMLEHLQSQNTMDWLYLMPANAYGPGDHFLSDTAHVIPATILKLQKAYNEGKNEIEVWGDGSQVRDFIYVDDLCYLVCRFLRTSEWNNAVVNISTGKGTTINDIVTNLKNNMKLHNLEIKWLLDKPIGIPSKTMSNGKLLSIIGEYSFTPIEDGLKKTVEWYYKNR